MSFLFLDWKLVVTQSEWNCSPGVHDFFMTGLYIRVFGSPLSLFGRYKLFLVE